MEVLPLLLEFLCWGEEPVLTMSGSHERRPSWRWCRCDCICAWAAHDAQEAEEVILTNLTLWPTLIVSWVSCGTVWWSILEWTWTDESTKPAASPVTHSSGSRPSIRGFFYWSLGLQKSTTEVPYCTSYCTYTTVQYRINSTLVRQEQPSAPLSVSAAAQRAYIHPDRRANITASPWYYLPHH